MQRAVLGVLKDYVGRALAGYPSSLEQDEAEMEQLSGGTSPDDRQGVL